MLTLIARNTVMPKPQYSNSNVNMQSTQHHHFHTPLLGRNGMDKVTRQAMDTINSQHELEKQPDQRDKCRIQGFDYYISQR
jgi:hypothetical protein